MDNGGQDVGDRLIGISQGCAERPYQIIDLAQRAGGIDGGSRDPGTEIFFQGCGEAGAGYPYDGSLQKSGQDLRVRGGVASRACRVRRTASTAHRRAFGSSSPRKPTSASSSAPWFDRAPQRAWATPLEVLLTAERAALLTGRDDEFTLLVTIGYTGMRWAETTGLERDLLVPTLINVEWQLYEIKGRFYRLPPKDDSYRSTNWDPFVPVDIPDFLAALLAAQVDKHAQRRCACFRDHDGTGHYLFYSPEGGHYRRSNFARRVFRPACDGHYPPAKGRPGNLVVTDATAWPGKPVASWPPAMPGRPFTPPAGRGTQRLVSTDGIGNCPSCGRSAKLRLDGTVIAHKTGSEHCPGGGKPPADDVPLACWLPVKEGLTPHGLRHSHRTWMAEDGIPEILAEQRLGHDVPGMRGLYTHVTQAMREDLTAALQARWETSLRDRAALNPRSPVPLLDNLLAPYRAARHDTAGHRAPRPAHAGSDGTGKPSRTSQISPNMTTAPIRSVG